ncbi:MAG: hypothetical protein E7028_05700 [Planctomycetaceae bacterium]|nr:hypothetical protein [Planctomycetaceae bacterium]
MFRDCLNSRSRTDCRNRQTCHEAQKTCRNLTPTQHESTFWKARKNVFAENLLNRNISQAHT